MLSLSIVIPAYNEEKRLPASLENIFAFVNSQRLDFVEIIVVDDGSQDATAALVERAAAADARIRLLRNPGNRGKGYAVRHGMREARGDWRLITDADLSAPIEELAKLHDRAAREQADIAIGSRALDRSLIAVHQPAAREWMGRFFNLVMRLVTGLPFADTQCGFKLFRGDAARGVFGRQRLEGFGFDVEVLFIARVLGYRTVEVPVRWSNVEGTTVSMAKGLAAFTDLLRVRWYWLRGWYRQHANSVTLR